MGNAPSSWRKVCFIAQATIGTIVHFSVSPEKADKTRLGQSFSSQFFSFKCIHKEREREKWEKGIDRFTGMKTKYIYIHKHIHELYAYTVYNHICMYACILIIW